MTLLVERLQLQYLLYSTTFVELDPFCKRTFLGAVQCLLAENIAIGPSFLNGSST